MQEIFEPSDPDLSIEKQLSNEGVPSQYASIVAESIEFIVSELGGQVEDHNWEDVIFQFHAVFTDDHESTKSCISLHFICSFIDVLLVQAYAKYDIDFTGDDLYKESTENQFIGFLIEKMKSLQPGIDWQNEFKAFEKGAEDNQKYRLPALTRLLCDFDLIFPLDFIDVEDFITPKYLGSLKLTPLMTIPGHSSQPYFWLYIVGRERMAPFILKMFQQIDAEYLGQLASSWEEQLGGTGFSGELYSDRIPAEEIYPMRAKVLGPCFHVLNEQIQKDENPLLRQMWLKYACFLYDSNQYDIDKETARMLYEYADKTIGTLRPIMRDAEAEGAADELKKHFLYDANSVVVRMGSMFKSHRGLIQNLRALSVPCVASDLRYWNEIDRDPAPSPWNVIPMLMNSTLHTFARKEEKLDPKLVKYREQLCRYFLDRLKAKKKGPKGIQLDNEMMQEKDPHWRYCYIRAIHELKVNPSGKGHHVLYWSSQNDPEENVRKAADAAYKELRHGVSLPESTSLRRAVLAAFWWLRQAHLLGLENYSIIIDQKGAQRVREKEVRRSIEIELH